MTNIRVCESSGRGPIYSEGEGGGQFWLSLLDACSPYKPRGTRITYLAGGSYGAVFDIDVVNRRKHVRHNVALKVITIGSVKTAAGRRLKEETLSEMHFGQMMSDANIGPKIYDQFIFRKKGGNKEWGLILMEKFQGSGADFLWAGGSGRNWGATPNTKNRAIVIHKMMELAKRMVSKGLYCWDIKPGNYVANVNGNTMSKIKVRMIDFGGQFCVFGMERRDAMIKQIRSDAAKMHVKIPSLMKLTPGKFNDIFYHLIMMPFLVLLDDRYMGFDFQEVARPILNVICADDTVRTGMVLILQADPVIFKTFQHYTRKAGESPKTPNQTVAYFASVIQDLCLQNTPSPSSRARILSSTRRSRRSNRSKRTKKSKTPDRLKAARRTRRRLRLRRRRRGGKSFNPHTLIKPGLQDGKMSDLAKSLQKPDRIHRRLVQLHDALT